MDHDKWTPDETSRDKWTAVDRYFSEQLSLSDPALDAALAANKAAELPAIDVAPNQGKFLQLLALLVGARNVLEIGTLGGYSSIWLARALPAGGRLITPLVLEPGSCYRLVASRIRPESAALSTREKAGGDARMPRSFRGIAQFAPLAEGPCRLSPGPVAAD